ncbi:hypothetical protein Gohar_002802 [Gossypium harknessii]|uniref:Uncharacterized protein n=1 Tax=Gossypium harknessii TaxID=34285 RepID=A0A7J9HN76_9ROSI|nr:hypothetical protein [Gossypium harknessii]MBA0810845.1 hypothetical protein [Gossypium harknessii]
MKNIWNLQPETRIVVDANQYGQPILVRLLCYMCRKILICKVRWRTLTSSHMLENSRRSLNQL